jgi:hypothetical protein
MSREAKHDDDLGLATATGVSCPIGLGAAPALG